MKFEWDEKKNLENIRKHGFDFKRARKIFKGRLVTFQDTRREYDEIRYISIGKMESIVIITVVHTKRDKKTRIISARRANKKERRMYEKN